MKIDVDTAYKLQEALYRKKLWAFSRYAFSVVDPGTPYENNWHLECICDHLDACVSGDIKRLIVNIPPRSLKSIICSVAFPAFVIGNDSGESFICASYSSDLALDLSQKTRLVMESEYYQHLFPKTVIAEGENRKKDFRTTARGVRYATSVGGTVTGMGGNYIVLDDPNKPEDMDSDVMRKATNDWVDQTLSTRLNNRKTGRIIIIQQRLHQDDVTGHLLEKGGWHHLKIPGEAKKRIQIDLGKKSWVMEEGEFLHPARFDKGAAEQAEREMGPYGYAGQILQEPVPLGGGEFREEWVNYYHDKLNTRDMNIYILVDPAGAKKKTSDYTAMIVVGLGSDNNYYWLDGIRDRLNPTERIDRLIDLHKKWNYAAGKSPMVGYESYGLQSDIHFIKMRQEQISYRFPIAELKSPMQKEARIRRLIAPMQTGRWWFPPNLLYTDSSGMTVDLVRQFIKEEMLVFPVGRHDDMIDAMSRIEDPDMFKVFPRLKQKSMTMIQGMPYERKEQSWVDY